MSEPSQRMVEAKAVELFGAEWKSEPQHQQALLDAVIAARLDAARAVVAGDGDE